MSHHIHAALAAFIVALFAAVAGFADDAKPSKPSKADKAEPVAKKNKKKKAKLAPLTKDAQRVAEELKKKLAPKSEARLMLDDILKGSRLGPTDGWFRVAKSQTRFGWKHVAKTFDKNKDAKVTPEEFGGRKSDFQRLDRNGDGKLTAADFDWSDHALARSPGFMLFYMADRDGNGHVTKAELATLFDSFDSGKRGFLSLDDLKDRLTPPSKRSRGKRSDGPSRSTLILGLARQEIGSLQPGPGLNAKAPDFTLPIVNDLRKITLSKEIGEQPVVLVFGNFTCGPFRSQSGNIHKLYERYKGRAKFFMIYVREAHPNDGWHMESNKKVGVNLNQPTTDAERQKVAQTCQMKLNFAMPFLVDSIKDQVGATYSGMPSRLYVIDRQGKVAYKSGRGPFGFKPAECEQSLILLLNQRQPKTAAKTVGQTIPSDRNARFPALDNAETWSRIPKPPLPVWARMLSGSLPRAAAAMLRLDYIHRTKNPLDPVLRGKLRWVAANANRCDYSRRYAEADLLRAGMTKADIAKLSGNHAGLPQAERELLAFAKKLTLAAHSVSDDEFAAIMKRFGPEKTVAIVHTLAQANFQDRIFLALRVQVEADGPYSPLDLPFDPKGKSTTSAPKRSPWKSVLSPQPGSPGRFADQKTPRWNDHDFTGVQKLLANQKRRSSRIPLPEWSVASKKLPPELQSRGASPVIWSNVSLGYQPKLTQAWFDCMGTFRQESDLDRVFSNSMFWVVTRSNQCFY